MDSITRIKEAFKRYRAAGEEWIEATLALASELHTARQKHISDRAFGVWLVENDLDEVGHQDRAALLKIAEHPDLFRAVALDSGRNAPRYIWELEMLPGLPIVGKAAAFEVIMPEVAESRPVAEESGDSVPANDASTPPIESAPTAVPPASPLLLGRSPLKGLPKAEVILRYLKNADTRSMLGKVVSRRGGKLCWELLVEAITSGAFGPPSEASVSRATLRLILPWAPLGYASKFDLLEPESRAKIRQNILPVVLAEGEALRRDPSRLPDAVAAHVRERAKAGQQQRETQQRAAAIVALPATEQPIQVYGKAMWPWTLTSTAAWTYQEALEAWWFFRAIHGYLLGTPHERAVTVNLMLRWATPAHRTGWAAALRFIALQYELNPEGETRSAPPPINFGE